MVYTHPWILSWGISCVYIPLLDLNDSIAALEQVNTTVVNLVDLTQMLQRELNDINMQISSLRSDCLGRPNANALPCNVIPNTTFMVVVNYSAVRVSV